MNPQHRRPTVGQLILLALFLAVCVVGIVSSASRTTQDASAASVEEREFKNTVPEHVPIKVKIRKEKEQAFKDLKNKSWARDLEIEIKNTGSKPIYFMYMLIDLPEFIVHGYPYAFQVSYGRKELVYFTTPRQPDDVPILPGESITLKVSDSQVRGYEKTRDKEGLADPKKVEFDMQLINFGDGTGLVGKDGRPLPDPAKRRSQNVPCPKDKDNAGPPTLERLEPDSFGSHLKAFYSLAPARILRVNFYPLEDVLTSNSTPALPDLCGCQNTNACMWGELGYADCHCDNPHEFFAIHPAVSCSNPNGSCRRTETKIESCDTQYNGTVSCQFQADVGRCAIGDPTPSPTPSPTLTPYPTQTPTPTPSPTPCPNLECTDPAASFAASSCAIGPFDSHCPAGYEQRGNCCYVIPCPSPTPTPPACEGTLTWEAEPLCQWRCFIPPPQSSACEPGQARNCINARGEWNAADCLCTYPTGSGTSGVCFWCNSPILIDTSGDGFRLTDAQGGVSFDLNHDGTPERLSWTALYSNDAFLALDRNANGRIDNGAELFGDATLQPPTAAPNGFLALSVYDRVDHGGNGDKVIDQGDAIFEFLRLWLDANHNGESERGELFTLEAVQVESISLDYKEARRVDRVGNQFRYRAKVDDRRHSRVGRWAWDVFLISK